MQRLKRAVLFISMMAQPQQVITGHDLITLLPPQLFIIIINCHLRKVSHRHQIKDLFLISHRRLQNWLKCKCSNFITHDHSLGQFFDFHSTKSLLQNSKSFLRDNRMGPQEKISKQKPALKNGTDG